MSDLRHVTDPLDSQSRVPHKIPYEHLLRNLTFSTNFNHNTLKNGIILIWRTQDYSFGTYCLTETQRIAQTSSIRSSLTTPARNGIITLSSANQNNPYPGVYYNNDTRCRPPKRFHSDIKAAFYPEVVSS